MQSDCTVPIDNGFINVRVGAIIMNNGRFLMVENECYGYVYSVGGRVKFGETAESAVVREVFEETGIFMEIDRLGFVHENYFYGDSPSNMGKLIYEISFFFYMKLPKTLLLSPEPWPYPRNSTQEKLVWVDTSTKTACYPDFFREELKKPCTYIKYFVTDERKKDNGSRY